MRKAFTGSLLALCAGAGLVWAEPETTSAPPPPIEPMPVMPHGPAIGVPPSRPLWGRLPGPHEGGPVADVTEFAADEPEASYPSYGRFYFRADYLLWWLRPDHTPPLVTTGPATVPTGVLGAPTTTVLFGGNLNHGADSGVRLTAGAWLDDCQSCGIEVSGFILGQNSGSRGFNSSQFPVLARPFFNLNTGTAATEIDTFPGLSTGGISISNHSNLGGANADMVHKLCCSCWYRVDLIAGFCFLDLDEDLTIVEQGTDSGSALLPPILQNATFTNTDRFHTRNQFYGGEIGARGEFRWGRVMLDLDGKVALGTTHEVLDVNGSQVIVGPMGTSTFTGGLLALPSNIGHFTHNRFAVVPELEVDLGYQVTDHLRFLVGYDFLYWSSVLRPGHQIDTTLDASQIPNGPGGTSLGQTRPAVLFRQSDFWAQGLNVGVEVRY